MNKLSQLLHCTVLALLVCLTSCGYVSDKPPANATLYKTDELQTCKIDIDKLGEIFKADQKEQIQCLQDNFIQFTKYVRSKNPGSISEGELNVFVRKFFEGQSDSIIQGLSLIFQLNMLLLRDEADRISKTNISPLFELLVKVNQEAIVITQVVKEMDDEKNQGRFWDLREKFNASVNRFCDFTLKIIENSPGSQQKLNIKEFIIDAGKKLGTKGIDADTVDSLIFLKRVLVAGDKEVITSDELKTIVQKLPRILSLSFDLYYVKSTNFGSDAESSRFYIESVNELYRIIEFKQADFQLVTVDQILKLAQDFIKDKDVKKFKPSIVSIKARLIGGAQESFSLQDLRAVLDIGKDLLERNYFNNVTYNSKREVIESPREITSLEKTALTEYNIFSAARVNELFKDFQDVAVNIRYYRSQKEGIPTYGTIISRNRTGFLEALYLKWGAQKLLKGYGHKNAQGIQQVNLDEFQTFLFDMKPVLEEFKLWSPNPQTFARNAILLADLFQNKSNGDLEVNETEATEYLQMILSAVKISDKFSDELEKVCDGGVNKDDPAFSVECFNQNFFDTFLNKANYNKNFPSLSQYISNAPKDEVDEYLNGVEGFARDVNDPKIPINERDTILIQGAMLNIESTLIRFDANKDGIIDNQTRAFPDNKFDKRTELEVAFEVYKKAIISIAKLRPDQEQYAYAIFLYMIKYMKVPPAATLMDNVKFWLFYKFESSSYIAAKRLNIGSILYYLVNQPTPTVAKNKDRKQ